MAKKVAKFWIADKWQILIICLLSFLVYSNTLGHEFALDDGLMILENKLTKQGFSGIGEILFSDQFTGVSGQKDMQIYSGSRYRPLSQIVFAIEYDLFGLNARTLHFINILFYLLLGFILFRTIRTMLGNSENKWIRLFPFAATLLFMLHPIHTEVVANIKSLDEILAMLLSLLSLYFSMLYYDKQKLKYLLFVLLSLFLALLAKENSITFLAVIPLAFLFFRKLDIKITGLVMSSALLAIAGYFVFRYQSLGYIMNSAESDDLFHNVFVNVDGMTKYAMIFYSWGKYLFLLIFPHPLTHDYYPYQIPEVGFENLIVIASLIISLALVVFALIKIKSKHMVAFGILFYFITFSVVSNLVFNLGLLMNERLIFMPSLGYSIILAYLLVKHLYPLLEKKRKVSWFFGVAIILLGLYSAKSISRNTDWKNDNTLYYKDVETSVNSARCNVVAGSLMIIEAKTKTIQNERLVLVNKGIKYVERGLKLHPDNPQGWIALGEAFYHRGELERSFRFYKETYKYDEISRVATDNLKAIVVTFKEKGNIDKAKQLVDELIKQNSENNSFYILKAEVLMANKEYEQALNILNSRVDSGIEDAGIYNKLSEIHGRYLNNLSIAKEYSLKGYALDDKDITILENLGVIAGLEGNFQEAAEYFKKAYGLDPTNKNVVNNLISTYLQMGDEKSANFYKSRIPGN